MTPFGFNSATVLPESPQPEIRGRRGPKAGSIDRRISVVHVVSTLNIGGLEKVVLDLTRLATRDRFDVSVVCLGEPGVLAPEFAEAGVEVHSLGACSGSRFSSLRRLRRYLIEKRPQVVHTHNPAPHRVGGIAARLAGIPVLVHTKHGRNYPEQWRWRLASRMYSMLSHKVVAVSADAADVACRIEGIPKSKVDVILNGVDLDGYPFNPTRDRTSQRRAIHVARLIYPTKDQVTLLRAVRIVANEEPEFVLDIVGDGPSRELLVNLGDELKLGGHVRFLGFRSDVADLMASAEYFVLSSKKEGISLTLLEAMACGLATVATSVGGNPEVVADGETGLLVPPESPEALAKAMLALLRNPAAADRMGVAGRARVAERFDLKGTLAKYEDLYVRLLHERRRLSQ
jgi:sugar transferase (PEP-CTERM/EpsH1 system associated)